MKKTLLLLTALALLSARGFSAALVQVSGGGYAGSPVEITILSDITLHVTQGGSIGGYSFGFVIPGIFSSTDGYNYEAVGSTSGFTYQTDPGAPVANSDIAWTQTAGSDLITYFNTTSNYAEALISAGGSITFKAGTILGQNYRSENILNNPSAIYTLTESSFFTYTEAYGYDAASVSLVPEPSTYALLGLGALGLVIAYRRRTA
jgi:hypothetical protein